MTTEKVNQLEIDVAVIKTDMGTLKQDTKSVKSLLKWFIVLTSGLIILVVGILINSAGEKKLMQKTLMHNSMVIGDLASQGVDAGWYKPDKEVYRNGKEEKN